MLRWSKDDPPGKHDEFIYVTGNTAIAIAVLKLSGTDEEVFYANFKELLECKASYDAMSHASNPYGDGLACKRIADIPEGKLDGK